MSFENLKGKRILVTGGAGFIGSHTVIELQKCKADVVILDSLVNASEKVIGKIEEITGVKPQFNKLDLCDNEGLQKFFKAEKTFDAVIHFAGLKAVGESVSSPLKYYENNLLGTINLLKHMSSSGCKKLVFSSSATVYGDSQNVPFKEDEPLSTTNPYGSTKLFIEQVLRDVVKSDSVEEKSKAKSASDEKWKIAILRYFNPIGAHESGLIGEDPNGVPNNLVPYLSQVAVGRLERLRVFGSDYDTPDGTGVRDYIHVVDLAFGHLAALSNGIFASGMRSNCEAFNLGSGEGNSVLQLVAAMEKACGKKVPYALVDRRPGDVAKSYADASKAKRDLKWQTQLSLQRAIDDAWRWQSRNPNGFASTSSTKKT